VAVQVSPEKVRSQLRESLQGLSAALASQERAYAGLNGTIYVVYAIECFLRALSECPAGRSYVLKGGNLFRVWDGLGSFRPTGDLDMQCVDGRDGASDAEALRREVKAVVETPSFRDATGLHFVVDDLRMDMPRKRFPVSHRLQGRAYLGEPGGHGSRPAEIPFCLEVTYATPPEGAVELSEWKSVLSNGSAFKVLASRPEWMAAEKFHGIVTRGVANTRLKDFRDLLVLLRSATFDDQLLHGCVRHVFAEQGHSHLVPEAARDVATLTEAFASAQNEYLWQRRRWPEWEGREWRDGIDPTLSETIAALTIELERKGVVAESAAALVATSMGDLCRFADAMRADGPKPVTTARYATALKALASAASDADASDAAWRWLAVARRDGRGLASLSDALADALAAADDMGLMAAIDRGWDRGRGGGAAALDALRARLAPGRVRAAAPETRSAEAAPSPKERTARRPRANAALRTPDETMSEGVRLLSEGEPGSHAWFGGLAKVLASSGARVPDPGDAALDMPQDPRAPFIWPQVARRHSLEQDLESALALAREILGLPGPGPVRPR
jgi:hypothetical protein